MEIVKPEEKFWNARELVERLFWFLDPASALHLAEAQLMDKKILRESLSSKAWKNLVKQISCGGEQTKELKDEQREDVRALVATLKLVEPKDPIRYLLPLLDLICQRFPSRISNGWLGDGEVQMGCPCQEDPHKISMKGFMLLEEEVEGVFGTTVQTLKSVRVENFFFNMTVAVENLKEPGLLAICSRMSRQEIVTSISVYDGLEIEDNTDIQAVSTLLQAQQVCLTLKVCGSVGREGWEMLARAMQANPSGVWRMEGSIEGLADARREDIKDIWEAVRDVFIVWDTDDEMLDGRGWRCLAAEKPGDTWTRLEQILDLTKKELVAEAGNEFGIDSDEWNGDSDEDGENEQEDEDKSGSQGKPDN